MSAMRPFRSALAAALLSVSPIAGAQAPREPRTLTVAEALAELEAQNLTLAQARDRAEEARGVARQALAALLPTLSASGNYTRNSDQARISIRSILAQLPLPPAAAQSAPGDVVIQPLESFTVSGTIRVPIFVPSAWADLDAAAAVAASAGASAQAVRHQIRAALQQAAWTAAGFEEVVSASERAVAIAHEQAESAQRAVQAGTAAPLSVLQAQTQSTQRESDLVRARAELERARLAAGVLLGTAAPVRITVGPAEPPASLDPAALVPEALAQRPELDAQRGLVRSAENQLTSARWRLAPQLSAGASAFASDVPYPTGKNQGWRVGVDLVWALYDGGFRYGKWHQAEAALAEARAGAEAQRLGVIEEVEDALRDLRVSRERVRLGEEQRRLAAETAASAKRSFDAGVAGSIEVLDANDRLFQSEVGLADARARLGVATVNLNRAMGRP